MSENDVFEEGGDFPKNLFVLVVKNVVFDDS